jgi:hypothetical protein
MTGGDISRDLDVPREMRPEAGLERELYNNYFLSRDSDFLKHMEESIPILKEKGSDGSAHYPPLIMNRFALGLARERVKGRENQGEIPDMEERIKSYAGTEKADPLVTLINVQLARYSKRKTEGVHGMEDRLKAWTKLADAKVIYFREKARAYMAGIEDTRQVVSAAYSEKMMEKRFKRIRYSLVGLALTLFVGLPTVLYFGGRVMYHHTWEEFTGYTDKKINSSRIMLKSDVDKYITKLETIANSQEQKVRDMVYEDIIPQLQAGQLSPKTMRLLNELGESLENPEDKGALIDMMKFFSRKKSPEPPEKKKDAPEFKEDDVEEQY